MNFLLGIIGVIVAGGIFLFARAKQSGGNATMPPAISLTASEELDALFNEIGWREDVDPDLLKAISIVESALNANAVRNNPPNDVSVGMMQILCIPDANGKCTNRLDVEGWRGITFEELKNPRVNIQLGARILQWNIQHYGFPRGIAVYNNWGARHSSQGGPFPNDAYVSKVLFQLKKLKGG